MPMRFSLSPEFGEDDDRRRKKDGEKWKEHEEEESNTTRRRSRKEKKWRVSMETFSYLNTRLSLVLGSCVCFRVLPRLGSSAQNIRVHVDTRLTIARTMLQAEETDRVGF